METDERARAQDAERPHTGPRPNARWHAAGIVACLFTSATSLALAPLLMPDSYSWVSHTTSESAAQGVSGAWLARLGFLVFGLGVLWLTNASRWGRWESRLHGTFGILMIATAAFSHRSFEAEATFDLTEDLLHSVTATSMGFAFALGILVTAIQRRERGYRRVFDLGALAASIVIPLSMGVWSDRAGLLQRGMFLVAYLWYASEALDTPRSNGQRR